MSYYTQGNTAKYSSPKTIKSPKIQKARISPVGKQEIKVREDISKSRKLFAISLVSVVLAMSCAIAFNSLVSSKQMQLDMAEQQLNQAVIVNQNLNTEKATLDSPARIIRIASNQLRMSSPMGVQSLSATNPYFQRVSPVVPNNLKSKQQSVRNKKIQSGRKK
ncbi:MAG: cell division protein FtsL [Firmicutes bacterium]|jgi:cell division protein FtsL|nr:cell division protein FtsL [Bacillota bacterium]